MHLSFLQITKGGRKEAGKVKEGEELKERVRKERERESGRGEQERERGR